MHIHIYTHTQTTTSNTHIFYYEKQLSVTFSISSYSFDAQATRTLCKRTLVTYTSKPIKNKTIVSIILNKYIHVHIHEKGIRTTKLMFFWGRRLCRLHFEPASVDNLFVHSTCWPRLKSAQSHRHMAQTEIGSLTVHRSWPKRRSAQFHSNITCPAPKEQVSIQYWANLALTQHLNLNISPLPTHTPCNGREEHGTHTLHKYTNKHDESVVFRLQVLMTSDNK